MDDLGSIKAGDRSLAIFGLLIGAIPFFVSVSESSSVTVNGVVTASTYRDTVAIGCGGAALICGAIALVLVVRRKAWGMRFGLAIGATVLGGLQLARGFGVFQAKGQSSSSVSVETTTPTAPPPPVDHSPAHCPSGDACNDQGVELEKAKDLAGALVAFTAGCKLDNPIACSNAGNYLLDGKGTPADHAKAASLYTKACDGDFASGCSSLGVLYYHGDGVTKDLAKGIALMEKACVAKNGQSCRNAGIVYRDDTKDLAKALERFTTACDLDDARGCNALGGLYDDKHDNVKSFAAYDRACKGGLPGGCYNVGLDFQQGTGTKKDLVAARDAYSKGCDGEDMEACDNLGVLLDHGAGGPADHDKAVELYQKACDGKSDIGCKNLAKTKKKKKK